MNDDGNTALANGEATLAYYEQVLQDYSNSIAPQSAVSNTGWTLLVAAGITIALILVVTK
jgi:hypothetical protein